MQGAAVLGRREGGGRAYVPAAPEDQRAVDLRNITALACFIRLRARAHAALRMSAAERPETGGRDGCLPSQQEEPGVDIAAGYFWGERRGEG
jgi:hypothetical protein